MFLIFKLFYRNYSQEPSVFVIENFQLTFSLSVSVNSVSNSQPSPTYFNFVSILISFLLQV